MIPTPLGTAGRRGFVALLASLAVVACTATPVPPVPRPAIPSATAGTSSGDKAADLRAQLDLLLGEQVLLLARTGNAAAADRTDEQTGFEAMVRQNSGAIASLLGRVAQSSQVAQQVSETVGVFDGAATDYAAAAFKKDLAGENAAMTTLTTTYISQMSAVLAPLTGLSKEQLAQLLSQQVLSARTLVDAQVKGGEWSGVFADVLASYDQVRVMGDGLAAAMASHARSRYPGDSTTRAATLAVALETGLQEQVHLMAMAASAAVGKRPEELAGARAALRSSQDDLGQTLAAIGPDAPAQATRVFSDATAAFVDDAVAAADKDVTGQQLADAQLTAGFATAASQFGKEAGVTLGKALALARAVGEALVEAAAAEGARNYETAPFAVRDAAAAATTMAGAVAAAIVRNHPRDFA